MKVAQPCWVTFNAGAVPSAYDRVLGTRFGIAAIDLIGEGNFGKMVALRGQNIIAIDLKEAVSKLRTVDMGLYDIAKYFLDKMDCDNLWRRLWRD